MEDALALISAMLQNRKEGLITEHQYPASLLLLKEGKSDNLTIMDKDCNHE